jgi:hypothetical protein
MRNFWFKQYINEIFLLKQYSNEIMSFNFIQSHSTPVILPIFNLNRENQTDTVQDLNAMKKKILCSAQLSGADRGKLSISPMPRLGCRLRFCLGLLASSRSGQKNKFSVK